jgi:parallel beta-helix repeat protein
MIKNPVLLNKTLVIGIIILLVGICANPSTGSITEEISNKPILKGNTLYVGGTGPGNYSTIQEAIDDTSNGDTVFVYDDSSPYYENIDVDKSINLIGEDKHTTIIDGNFDWYVVSIRADSVTIDSFTIINSDNSYRYSGIDVRRNHTTIINNIIKNNGNGITISRHEWFPKYLYRPVGNIISNNIVSSNTQIGIYLKYCDYSKVTNNIVTASHFSGISIYHATNNLISGNEISNNNHNGVSINYDSNNNEIIGNNIENNKDYGINILTSKKNLIVQNNFIDNFKRNARFVYTIQDFQKTVWDENYWSEQKHEKHFIFGRMSLNFIPQGIIPWLNIDHNPASEPYDI